MKKVIYFYGPDDIKKYKGLAGIKEFARKNRYQLRDATLSSIDGNIEKADEYKGSIPESYKSFLGEQKGTISQTEQTEATSAKTVDENPKQVDPTA